MILAREFSFLWRGRDKGDRYFLANQLAQFVQDFVFIAVHDTRVVLGLQL